MGEPNQIRQWQRDEAKPETHVRGAVESMIIGMNGTGNSPARCFANSVDAAIEALRRGLPADELDLMPAAGRLPSEENIVMTWRIIASALEGEAVRRWREMEAAAA